MKKIVVLLIFVTLWIGADCQTDTTTTRQSLWTGTVTLGGNYSQTKLNNPPVGYGSNQASGNIALDINIKYNKSKILFNNFIIWKFGLLRIGSGPLQAGSTQKIPFQKTLDRLEINSTSGYRISRDSTVFLLGGFNIFSQATPSFKDPDGILRGQFVRNIRGSNENPIQSRLFSPAQVLVYVGIGYKPTPKLFIRFTPAAYKAIMVLDDNIAQLVGKVDNNNMPEATVHGNPVEIKDGVPVFKNVFNQFGAYLAVRYNDDYFKKRISLSSALDLYSNYLNNPEKIDVWWKTQLNLNLFKGLSLSYSFNLFYDDDILVAITDNDVPGGLTGELGKKVSLERQLMLQ